MKIEMSASNSCNKCKCVKFTDKTDLQNELEKHHPTIYKI